MTFRGATVLKATSVSKDWIGCRLLEHWRHPIVELAAGTHPEIVANRIGHKRTETTLDTYSYVSTALRRTATATLERRLEATISDTPTSAEDGTGNG
ncbi:MAG: hypothetical protein ACR2GI_01200 [Thermomicrobiales bacterium]